eukprot:TRINITY_DN1517_c0_g1_i1.p1 TRINITY_DN1517_c0_g1~~TRINITY_DN1517_c0_g1_i1.p1  ORF type:complete len:225 (-),score=76.61 TRINITY_DN1517_c0_g1_i1:121-795(-)
MVWFVVFFFFFQAEDGIRDVERSRGLGDVYKRQGINAEYMGKSLMDKSCLPIKCELNQNSSDLLPLCKIKEEVLEKNEISIQNSSSTDNKLKDPSLTPISPRLKKKRSKKESVDDFSEDAKRRAHQLERNKINARSYRSRRNQKIKQMCAQIKMQSQENFLLGQQLSNYMAMLNAEAAELVNNQTQLTKLETGNTLLKQLYSTMQSKFILMQPNNFTQQSVCQV